ncbi:hypothetical protein IZ6_10920 [Terrihabitans soli]|uniref:Uncharacterized protein n=1 Tax=Terrihabitans soli TaxID=708113 RepID=A0A6S6QQW1_9HYPH|nr:hypothetical protein [Terrihabitans soli]BCJ90357.1 hypothetical protein IZ6_10920 [Terrihabitans soli]
MTKRILTYTPTDETDASVTTYGHVFSAGVPLDLGEDEAAYARLKGNPEFSADGKEKRTKAKADVEPQLPADPSADESNDGKDAKTRAALQARALKTAKAEAGKESV